MSHQRKQPFDSRTFYTILQRFEALAARSGWTPGSDEYRAERKKFISNEVRKSFRRNFGTDAASLLAWRKICIVIGVGVNVALLPTVQACKAALEGIYVNIVDLVDAVNAGTFLMTRFFTEEDLAGYIRVTGKIFPLSEAKGDPLLSEFLIKL